jgi:sulfatase maturation enzyme AslB (radical SAM superfamily)
VLDLLNRKKEKEKVLEEMHEQLSKARELKSKDFDVSCPEYRLDALSDTKPRGFKVCYYPHFAASITADMKLYPCCPLKGYEQYAIGDLSNASFKEVWLSEKRKKVHHKIDFKSCPNPCQFDGHARLLDSIKKSTKITHKNFL